MELHSIDSERFTKYGKVIKDMDFSEIIEVMDKIEIPEGVIYEPSIQELEKTRVGRNLEDITYGELSIQIGYCIGNNNKLNALEYHRSSEVNIGITEAVLLLGLQSDISKDFKYETKNVEGFILPKGVAVELYATTLHYAPCNYRDGFKVVVVLPKGTNYPLELEHKSGEDALIAAKNKWLIGHMDAGLPEGTHIGLIGENLTV